MGHAGYHTRKYPLNLFKIKDGIIPQTAYIWRFEKIFETEKEIRREVSNLAGALLDDEKGIFVTLKNIGKRKDVSLIKVEKFENLDISVWKKEELVSKYLRHVLKIEDKLDFYVRKVRPPRRFGNLLVRTQVRTQVKLVGKNFFLVVNFSHTVSVTKNLWDYVGRDPQKLGKYIGKRVKFALNPRYAYRIVKVKPPDRAEFERIINYIVNQKRYVSSVKELERRYGKLDVGQPILMCERGDVKLPFLPQLSFLVFGLDEIEGTGEAVQIQKFWRIENNRKLDIITKIVKGISDTVEPHPATFEGVKFDSSVLLVKDIDRRDVKISETTGLFSGILKGRRYGVYLPYDVPEFVRGKTIFTFVLLDSEIDELDSARKFAFEFFQRYNRIQRISGSLPYFDFSGRVFRFSRKNVDDAVSRVKDELKKLGKGRMAFAFIIGKERYEEDGYYEELKRKLFLNNVLSQNVLWETIKEKREDYISNNLIIQIMGKIGVKYFVLACKTDYDYILGVDVGEGIHGHKVAGCAVVFDSEGKLRKIVPVKVETPGETVDLPRIIEYLQHKSFVDFYRKNILLLRDGRATVKEIRDLETITLDLKASVTFFNIKKRHNFKIGEDEHSIAVSFGDIALLQPHTTAWGANPLKIDSKLVFRKGKVMQEDINYNDLRLLYDLTHLNYSKLFSEKMSFRLPAPLHYADKFIKALAKDWIIDESLLMEGCLYFI